MVQTSDQPRSTDTKTRYRYTMQEVPARPKIESNQQNVRAIDREVEGLGPSGISPCIPCNKIRPVYAKTPSKK